jgi:serine protease Do
MQVRKAVALAGRSVVSITTWGKNGRLLKHGSGFFFGKQCLIVTNAHVLAHASSIGVSLSSQRGGRRARLVARDDHLDVALLRLEKRATCQPLLPASNKTPVIALPVVSIGSPYINMD